MIFRFAYPFILWLGIPLVILIMWWRLKYHKRMTYIFPLTGYIQKNFSVLKKSSLLSSALLLNRIIILLLLLCITARPQLGERHTTVSGKGIAIMLVVDVSSSMILQDDPYIKKTRFQEALEQAEYFIDKRPSDEIGLVFFANTVVSRCPLTLDKQLLKKILHETQMGVIDEKGTLLSTAVALAAQRLKSAKAENKIMILLTDGVPSPNDISPQSALEQVLKNAIKIYTIGIGDENGQAYLQHPQFGLFVVETSYSQDLLKYFAEKSGGTFFEARKAAELHKIYTIIDTLEKSTYEVPWYTIHQELFMYFLIPLIILLVIQIFFKPLYVII